MYVHLVRPHMIMPLKCGLLIKLIYAIHMVEAVQRRATKLMVGNRISYKERLNKTTLSNH